MNCPVKRKNRKGAFLFFTLLLIVFCLCSKVTTGPADTIIKFTYGFPVQIGTTWTARHYFAALPHDSLSLISQVSPDTVYLKVADTATLFGKPCAIISSVKKGSRDTVYAAYWSSADSGLYRWAIDTAYAGQELFKSAVPAVFKHETQRMVPVFYSDTVAWAYSDGKGQSIGKEAALLDTANVSIVVTTSVDGRMSYRERYTADGLSERVYSRDKFFDAVNNDTLITIDSLVLIRN
jgi:hypothetical protein